MPDLIIYKGHGFLVLPKHQNIYNYAYCQPASQLAVKNVRIQTRYNNRRCEQHHKSYKKSIISMQVPSSPKTQKPCNNLIHDTRYNSFNCIITPDHHHPFLRLGIRFFAAHTHHIVSLTGQIAMHADSVY